MRASAGWLAVTAALLFAAARAPAAEEKDTDKPERVYAAALFPFEERGSPAKDMGAKVTDLLAARLGARPELLLVDRQDLQRALGEAELSLSGAVRPAEATRVGQLTGAKLLVCGSVVPVDKRLYLVARVIGTETGRVVSVSVDGKASDELAPLAEKLADKVAEAIARQADKLVAKPTPRADRLAALAQKLKGAKRQVVLVQVGERHVGAATADPAAQTELLRWLRGAGFEVVDPDEGARGQADLLITGEAVSEFAGRRGNLVSAKARVEVKAVQRRGGRVLAAERQAAVAVDLSEQLAGKAALQRAAAALAERLLPKLVHEKE